MYDEFNPSKLDYAAIHKQMQDKMDSMPPFENDGLTHLENIDKNTDDIAARFATEARTREIADTENMEYTKSQDRRNWKLAVFASIIGTIGAVAGIVSLIISIVQ